MRPKKAFSHVSDAPKEGFMERPMSSELKLAHKHDQSTNQHRTKSNLQAYMRTFVDYFLAKFNILSYQFLRF